MPTYQYACTACGRQLEAVQSFTDAALTECPTCAGQLRKVFSAVGIVFKGSGFYRNDSRPTTNSDTPVTAAAGANGAKDGKSDSKADSKSSSTDSSTSSSSGGSSDSSSSSSSSTSGSSKSGSSTSGTSTGSSSSASSSSSGGKKATTAV